MLWVENGLANRWKSVNRYPEQGYHSLYVPTLPVLNAFFTWVLDKTVVTRYFPLIVSLVGLAGFSVAWMCGVTGVQAPAFICVCVAMALASVFNVWRWRTLLQQKERELNWTAERRIQQILSMNEALSQELQQSRVLEEQREMQARAFDAFMQGVILTDPNRSNNPIVYVNEGFSRLLGFTPKDVLGKPIHFLQHAESDASVWEKLDEAIAKRKPLILETLNRRKDRSTVWTTISVAPVFEADKLKNFAFVLTDISDLKRYEIQARQTSKMEAIGHLAGGIAHDFNNLLLIINGSCELLAIENDDLPEPVVERIEEIEQAGHRAANLTQQLLAFSRKAVLQPKVLQLNTLIENLQRTLLRLVGEDIILRSNLAPDLKKVFVDPTQMEQLIINMAVNARDAMQKGGSIRIETRNVRYDGEQKSSMPEMVPGQYVALSITDNGHGMSQETLSRIFEPFFTTKGQGKGTGLGLAMAYGLVKSFGGHISVESQENQGTCFRIYLPVAKGESARPSSVNEVTPHGTETILLVEDEPGVRKVAMKALQTHGYRVLTASDGADALRLIQSFHEPIDLLLTDVVMPGMSGRELREEIERIRPIRQVIYTSGYTDDAVVRHGISASECDFIQKPFSVPVLLKKVRSVLDRERKKQTSELVSI